MCHVLLGHCLGAGAEHQSAHGPGTEWRCWTALEQAQALAKDASPVEQAFIEALAARYSQRRRKIGLTWTWPLPRQWARWRRNIRRCRRPHDLCRGLMDLTPWNFWTAEG
ncbi:MAG: hypothetical protein R2867_32290 [Caldilineaceae bacterium]